MHEAGMDGWVDTRTWTLIGAVATASLVYVLCELSRVREWVRSRRRSTGAADADVGRG